MNNQVTSTSSRKDDHLRICLEEDVRSNTSPGFERIGLKVQSLPELDFDQIDLGTTVFGKKLAAPLLISSMTGGSGNTRHFNQILARAANQFGIAMGVGSQRAAIEHPELEETFAIVRKEAPNALLFANLGVAQLNKAYGLAQCQRAVDMLEADGLYLHLNALQEVLQPEGNRNFSDLLGKIETITASLSVPVLAKEVGCGIDKETAQKLVNVGVKGIDVAGLGGTSWAAVEMYRQTEPVRKSVCANFINWGIPTVPALLDLSGLPEDVIKISSGGLESGIDVAKSLALGAELAGFARKFILAAAEGERELEQTIQKIILELKISLFLTGSTNLREIKGKWYS